MNERYIQLALRRWFTNYEYILFNTFMFNWESDFFALSKSGYSVEVEVKISKADFKKDFTKADKHNLLINHKKPAILYDTCPFKPYLRNGIDYDPDTYQYGPGDSSRVYFCCPADRLPNKFYYACPEGLLTADDIPEYAGLIWINNTYVKEVKKAPFLHKQTRDHQKELLAKYYCKHKNDRNDILIFLSALKNSDGIQLPGFITEQIERLEQKFA